MVEILQNKNSATRFQILVEIAAGGPGTQQKAIAARLGVTPQAVSGYMRQLLEAGLVSETDRSTYKISAAGVNWMLKVLRETNEYVAAVQRAVTNITTCAAIAESDLGQGQAVGLKMKDGLLYASAETRGGARGVARSSVARGQDVDVTDIQGLVELARGKVAILRVPGIEKGGSRRTDPLRLQNLADDGGQVGAIGIEALVALRRAGIEPRYLYGVAEAAVEAARCGLSFTVVCTEDAVPGLLKRLQEQKLDYELIDLSLG
ncbi:MAG: winged helix-turn-helix transcriptional regulator [Chloroflexi bacterium]|nr:winged helix-turn-helix transcriptional regulator [Chloroflexota bacterium]